MNLASQYFFKLKSCHQNIHYYFLAMFFSGMARGIHLILFNLYLQELGFREDFVGRAVALQALASVLILLPAGVLSDKFGRKRMLLWGSLGKGFFIFCTALTGRGFPLLLSSFGIGLSHSLVMVTNAPYLAENTVPKERLHLFSMSWFFIMFSSMVGNFLGGWITQFFMSSFSLSPLASKRGALIFASIVSFFVLVPIKRITEKRIFSSPQKKNLFVNLWQSKDGIMILRFTFASLLLGLGAGLFVPYFNLYFANRFQLSTGHVGTIMAMGQAFMAVAMLLGPPLAQRIGRVASICLFQLTSVLFLLILGQTQLLVFAIPSFLFRGALMNAANPLTTNLMMDNISDAMKGTANSMHQLVFQLGWVVCGPISGFLIASYSYSIVFYLAACLYLSASFYFWFIFRSLDRGNLSGKKKDLEQPG